MFSIYLNINNYIIVLRERMLFSIRINLLDQGKNGAEVK